MERPTPAAPQAPVVDVRDLAARLAALEKLVPKLQTKLDAVTKGLITPRVSSVLVRVKEKEVVAHYGAAWMPPSILKEHVDQVYDVSTTPEELAAAVEAYDIFGSGDFKAVRQTTNMAKVYNEVAGLVPDWAPKPVYVQADRVVYVYQGVFVPHSAAAAGLVDMLKATISVFRHERPAGARLAPEDIVARLCADPKARAIMALGMRSARGVQKGAMGMQAKRDTEKDYMAYIHDLKECIVRVYTRKRADPPA